MRAVRSRDTACEMAVRRRVHQAGLRYRVDAAPLPGFRRKADLVFPRARVAVFIDGCFWHGCPAHGTPSKANAMWWRDKIAGNRRRDEATRQVLEDAGWIVRRYWEHEDPEAVAEDLTSLIRALQRYDRRSGSRPAPEP
jgi:DNA mismatch endonuclease (patch repair protein)